MDTQQEKQVKLQELNTLLQTYGGELDIAPYVLEYLSLEELNSIVENILKKRETTIADNHEWLQQFKTNR